MEDTLKVSLEDVDRSELFGMMDRNADVIRQELGVSLTQRGESLLIGGEHRVKAAKVVRELIVIVEAGESLDKQKIIYVIELVNKGVSYRDSRVGKDIVCFTHTGKPLKAKTIGQKDYVNAIANNDIVFGIDPAGTGKT